LELCVDEDLRVSFELESGSSQKNEFSPSLHILIKIHRNQTNEEVNINHQDLIFVPVNGEI
jgi:hypothetical protein